MSHTIIVGAAPGIGPASFAPWARVSRRRATDAVRADDGTGRGVGEHGGAVRIRSGVGRCSDVDLQFAEARSGSAVDGVEDGRDVREEPDEVAVRKTLLAALACAVLADSPSPAGADGRRWYSFGTPTNQGSVAVVESDFSFSADQ